jgi:pantoate kinase
MGPTSARAFAPAAISTFFAIHDAGVDIGENADLSQVGATGGGFTLSKGVHSHATVTHSGNEKKISVTVNGVPRLSGTTTRRALDMMLKKFDVIFSSLELNQFVEVPIGYGFGTSAASALSGALAAARALGLDASTQQIAYFAHAADILSRTGLGTVSAIWQLTGAGIITSPGAPGVATIEPIPAPANLRVITASISPFTKSRLLSSPELRSRANKFGAQALELVLQDPSMHSLLRAGTLFSSGLGLQSEAVAELIRRAIANGAIGASQNMVGEAVHAVVEEKLVGAIADAFSSHPLRSWVEIFEIGTRPTSVSTQPPST